MRLVKLSRGNASLPIYINPEEVADLQELSVTNGPWTLVRMKNRIELSVDMPVDEVVGLLTGSAAGAPIEGVN